MKLLPILLLCPILSSADTFTCKVVGVSDGDTITCLSAKKERIKVKLYQIDAHEKGQDFGNKSKQYLSDLIFKQDVRIETHGKDKYKRTLGTIYKVTPYCGNDPQGPYPPMNINQVMIHSGMAWYYPFAKKNDSYKQIEEYARTNKVGLWSQKAITPWEWRKQK